MKRIIDFFLIMGLAVLLLSCGGIVEEEETETETAKVQTVSVTETDHTPSPETEETAPEEPEIPVYLNPDGEEFAELFGSFFHAESFTAAYGWDTGEDVVIFSVEYTADEPYAGTAMLSINGGEPFDISCVHLTDIRVTRDYIAVEPGYTDIGGPLWVFDYDGNLILAVYDVTAEGAQFRELHAADDDGITVFASRIRHMELTGSAALQLQAPYDAYRNLLWDDPTSDCLPGADAELPDAFSVDLSRGWDAVPDALNPALVVSGEYRIPYLGEGQFGQIVPTENMKTLQTYMEAQFGERTPAVTQESVAESVDITPPAGADLAAVVDHYLDLLMDGVSDYHSIQSVRDRHPDVFDALVALGEDAVPLLQERGHGIAVYDSTPENFRRMLALTMVQAISPQLYRYDYPSPDGRYAVRAEVDSHFTRWDPFQGTTYRLSLVDLETGTTMAVLGSGYSIDNAETPFRWTEDSRYAVHESGYRYYFTSVHLFDTVRGRCLTLPGEQELEAIAGENLYYMDPAVGAAAENVHCMFDSWDGDCIRVRVSLIGTGGYGSEIGYYLYDVTADQITEFHYDGATLPASAMHGTVSEYLDILAAGAESMTDEAAIIAAHPDAFAALAALGPDALPYLTMAAGDVPAMIADAEGYRRLTRAAAAMAAAYAIDPSLYDRVLLSDDRKTAVTAKVGSFMTLDWGGTRVTSYDRLVFTDAGTGEQKAVYTAPEPLINLRLEWSPDSRSVVFYHGIGGQHGSVTGGIVDAAAGEASLFPDTAVLLDLLRPSVPELSDVSADVIEGMTHTVRTWHDDGTVTVDCVFHVGRVMAVEGTYVFHPAGRLVREITAHVNTF